MIASLQHTDMSSPYALDRAVPCVEESLFSLEEPLVKYIGSRSIRSIRKHVAKDKKELVVLPCQPAL